MKGYVFDIKRFAVHDGSGIRTTAFLSGCQLDCKWCQNPEGKNPTQGNLMTSDELINEFLKDEIFYKTSNGGITLSGGDPCYQIDFAIDILTKAKEKSLHTAIETAMASHRFYEFFPLVDEFIVDIKIFDKDKHKYFTGQDNELILENFKNLCHTGKNIILRIPLIPNCTSDLENLKKIRDFARENRANIKIELLNYNKLCESKYLAMGREYEEQNPFDEEEMKLFWRVIYE